jgi:DNA sulfur modification protein DndE
MLEIVRPSERAKRQLITLKRNFGIENWNVLCRWALCISLAERTEPSHVPRQSPSNIEMNWKTFAGRNEHVYTAILKLAHSRCKSEMSLSQFFQSHLERGIGQMLTNERTSSILSLLDRHAEAA